MKIKKAFNVAVEVIITEDGSWHSSVRSIQNGQPLILCDTPEDLTEVFRKLSSSEAEGEKAE